ncbi:MAG: mechanosensitive ion channel family protein [Rhodocyclaceae bacterium]|nr:mechanosensitive ion channel family protein [Rhodocyclaceae bacterium]MBX3667818.1 mechanosensitive ion channel family protein [Rhodocyclaceae bacterium]
MTKAQGVACSRWIGRYLAALCLFYAHMLSALAADEAALVIGNRKIAEFRAPVGAFSPAERAEAARLRIARALEQPGDGWTSVKSTSQGVLVELDGKTMFLIVPGDAREAAGETVEDMANTASRGLQKVWAEARENRDPGAALRGAGKAAAALALLALALAALFRLTHMARAALAAQLAQRLAALDGHLRHSRVLALLPRWISSACLLAAWLLALVAVFLYFTYSLRQFVYTRPAAESLTHSLTSLFIQILGSVAGALPGMFVAACIFLAAWAVTQASVELFDHVASRKLQMGLLDSHTAPATRRIVNGAVWLFSAAMAYPYLPGAHTQAFQGLTVILGLMASIGASGLVGQIASGMILVYTRGLRAGEYVRIQDCEGTVIELGLFVTRMRTGLGEEISLPNALVLANVTRNYSRNSRGHGFVLETGVTIGYDTPWRQVHALLLEAAREVSEISGQPAPFVVQTALSDFYVEYKLVTYVDTEVPALRVKVASDLHAAIQDAFNRHGVQIMSPHYCRDPEAPKIVPQAEWHAAPAAPPRAAD